MNVHKAKVNGPPLLSRGMAKRKGKKSKSTRRASRPQPVQNLCFTAPLGALDASGAGATKDWYVNAAWIMSMMNRRAYHQVTKDGHCKYYGLGIQVFNCVNASATIRTAQLGYPTQNAVRAWHFARKDRFKEAGYNLSDLGHGERLRFALDKTHLDLAADSEFLVRPSHLALSEDDMGSWDWSDVIIVPPLNSPDAGSDVIYEYDLYDSFTLHLCGDHTVQEDGTALRFTDVGMIQAWTENRRGWATPSDEEVIQPQNPLAFARMSETVSKEIVEEVIDEQKQPPPYSNVDDDDAESVFAELQIQGMLEAKFPNPTTNDDLIVAPAGLAKVSVTNNSGEVAAPYLSVQIFELE